MRLSLSLFSLHTRFAKSFGLVYVGLIVPQTKSIKIIKDRDERPKGFGYIEFEELDGLKDAISRSGQVSGSKLRNNIN
jgi:RNA recognition motif-containing protein